MHKLHSIALACISLLTLTSATATYAGHQAGGGSFTLGGGEFFLASKRNMDNTGLGLGTLDYDFTDQWGVEGMLGGYNTHYKNRSVDDRTINGTIFSFDGVYRFGNAKSVLEPFVMAGVGIIGMNPNNNDANNEGNINAAIGLEYFVHPLVAIRVEARDFYTWVGGKNDVMVDAGVTFLFNVCKTC